MSDPKSPKIIIPKKKKIAFVCSGGAAKAGAFHLGVALALQEKGFKFRGGLKKDKSIETTPSDPQSSGAIAMVDDAGREITVYVGSSAGSIICTYLASGHSLDQVIDTFVGRKSKSAFNEFHKPLKRLNYATMFALRKDTGWLSVLGALKEAQGNFLSKVANETYDNIFKWKWLKWPGFFSTSGIERYIREDVVPSNQFANLDPDLFIVATQLNHSKKVVFGKYNYSPPTDDKTVVYMNNTSVSESCAASTALPPVYAPYPIENERGKKVYYFDGEIRDTLSTHVGFDAGADLIISSYSHQPYHFNREIGSLHEQGIPSILIQALYLLIERKIQAARSEKERASAAIIASEEFFKLHNLPDDMRKSFIDMLERKLSFKRGVDYIYIHPKSTDYQMFFGDHFNLSVGKMTEIVKIGFKSAIEVLRKYEFE